MEWETTACTSLHHMATVGSHIAPFPERALTESSLIDDVLDSLLDQEGLEVDPVDRLEGDTPLHKAVRYINGLSKEEWENGASVLELLLDAGADPRLVPYLKISLTC